MNRRLAAASGAAAAAAVIAVVALYGASDLQDPFPAYVYSQQTVLNGTIPPDIARTNNGFAIDFYKQILDGQQDENIFFSPISMYVAFSAVYEGAKGNTASQMQDVFGFEPDAAARHNATAHMMSSINRDDPHAILNMANALWLAEWFEPYDRYLDVGRGAYLADIETVSFTDEDDGVKRINSWAANKTHDKIKKVLSPGDVNAQTAMVLTNAIYFKGTWDTQFPKKNTKQADFSKSDGGSVRADFMKITDVFGYAQSDGAKVLKMPYEGDRLSMMVILPDKTGGIEELEANISAEQIEEWNHEVRFGKVRVAIPKFTTETSYDLKGPLSGMGMTDVFSPGRSDLSGIADVRLFVSTAKQKAFVDVNEEGTEAAAVTVIGFEVASKPPPPPAFIADHPFIFIIQDDQSGTILFMGRISDPTVGEV